MGEAGHQASGRSIILAVVLSGLGPGAGHVYVGRPFRGLALTALWIASNAAWTTQVATSYEAARLWAFPPLILLIAVLVDAGRLARRAIRPFPLGRLQRWWVYALIVVVTGFAVPTLLAKMLGRQVLLVTALDSGMEPRVAALDKVIVRPGVEGLTRGSVVALRHGDGSRLRRVVGLPGETVELRRGHVYVNAQPWLQDPARLLNAGHEALAAVTLGSDEYLALPDQRLPGATDGARIRTTDISGTARWVLIPTGFDPLRVGEAIR